jgi:hypothetical protein
MTPEFAVFTTRRFDRGLKKLLDSHPELVEHYEGILTGPKADPYNRSRRYAIKKLQAVPEREGQYRNPLWTISIPL